MLVRKDIIIFDDIRNDLLKFLRALFLVFFDSWRFETFFVDEDAAGYSDDARTKYSYDQPSAAHLAPLAQN